MRCGVAGVSIVCVTIRRVRVRSRCWVAMLWDGWGKTPGGAAEAGRAAMEVAHPSGNDSVSFDAEGTVGK